MNKALAVVFLLCSFNLFACLNGETKTLANGAVIYEDFEGIIPRGHRFNISKFPQLLKELDSLYKKTKKIEYLSDKGYVLILQGKYQEAIKLYLDIEKSHPNRYSTASNLGTAYELSGDNINALKWISRGVSINPDSHDSSEWLHIKILEAKINTTKINSDFFIGTNFGNFDMPVSELSQIQTQKMILALYFQLNERISFIKSDDSIIALLLFELGNLSMLESEFSDANQIFKIAKEYGYESNLLEKRISFTNGFLFAKKSTYSNETSYSYINYEKTILLIISILIALIGLYFLIKKLRILKKPSST